MMGNLTEYKIQTKCKCLGPLNYFKTSLLNYIQNNMQSKPKQKHNMRQAVLGNTFDKKIYHKFSNCKLFCFAQCVGQKILI